MAQDWGQWRDFFEHGRENCGSIQGVQLVYQPSYSQLAMKACVVCRDNYVA